MFSRLALAALLAIPTLASSAPRSVLIEHFTNYA